MGSHWSFACLHNIYRRNRVRLATGKLFHAGGHHREHDIRGVIRADGWTLQRELELLRNYGVQQRSAPRLANSERGLWNSRHPSHGYAPGRELLGRRGLQKHFLDGTDDQFSADRQNSRGGSNGLLLRNGNRNFASEISVDEKRRGHQRRHLFQLHNPRDDQRGQRRIVYSYGKQQLGQSHQQCRNALGQRFHSGSQRDSRQFELR